MRGTDVRTPKGAKLGERVLKGGDYYLIYKAGHKIDMLSPTEIVEIITGRKVDRIEFAKE